MGATIYYQGNVMVRYELEGEQQIIKEVKKQSTSGITYVPKKWVGRKVAIILLEKEK
jgi:putative transposon-encoded protein